MGPRTTQYCSSTTTIPQHFFSVFIAVTTMVAWTKMISRVLGGRGSGSGSGSGQEETIRTEKRM